jgi:signal recognition particle receptor subunit beta
MEYKILFTGIAGAGKTTAIAAVSEIPPLNTDVKNSDLLLGKDTTTVGLDYGELTLDGGDKLRLYGTPGQVRFEFMWQILARGALGLVILVDNRRPNPMGDLDVYLDGFKELIKTTACIVAVGRLQTHPKPSLDDFSKHLASKGVLCPVLQTDVRDASQVALALELLMFQLDAKSNNDVH